MEEFRPESILDLFNFAANRVLDDFIAARKDLIEKIHPSWTEQKRFLEEDLQKLYRYKQKIADGKLFYLGMQDGEKLN